MTIPNFLSNSFAPFRYTTVSTNDAINVLPVLRTELTALGWVETGLNTNVYDSPTDTAGHYMRAAFSRYSQGVLRMTLYSQGATLVCDRSLLIGTASYGSTVYCYTGKFHIFLDAIVNYTGGAAYYLAAYLLDTTPDPPASLSWPVVGNGAYTGTGGYDGLGLLEWWYALDGGSSNGAQRLRAPINVAGTVVTQNMASGRGIFDDCLVYINIGGTNYWAGRFCQTLLGPVDRSPLCADYRVPIDDGTYATFKATSLGYATGGFPYKTRIWMRKS